MYTITIHAERLQHIVACLESGPYRLSAPVLQDIMTQVQQQDRERQAADQQNVETAASERRRAEMEDQMKAAD